jgi:hypothetical protein
VYSTDITKPPPPPDWYTNPSGSGRRDRDGEKWTESELPADEYPAPRGAHQLERLYGLFRAGALTQEQFDAEKLNVLDFLSEHATSFLLSVPYRDRRADARPEPHLRAAHARLSPLQGAEGRLDDPSAPRGEESAQQLGALVH